MTRVVGRSAGPTETEGFPSTFALGYEWVRRPVCAFVCSLIPALGGKSRCELAETIPFDWPSWRETVSDGKGSVRARSWRERRPSTKREKDWGCAVRLWRRTGRNGYWCLRPR